MLMMMMLMLLMMVMTMLLLQENNSQRFYLGHEDEISCLTLHPDRDTVATGGLGTVPKIQIWRAIL